MSANDGDLVDRMAKKHSVSPAAVQVVLAALRSGGGRMAQFSHADFGGIAPTRMRASGPSPSPAKSRRPGVSSEAAAVAVAEVLDGIGDACPECEITDSDS